jgi:TetR/AcrR family acrAB operon transcriptional repressor
MVGKPKGESKETYEALLDAAELTFAERGVTRTTLNDVACSAGMTRGAVYWHFKDKGALVEALCDRVFLPMETMLNEITAAPEDDPMAALRGMMLEMLTQTATNPRQKAVFDILFHHCEKNDEMAFFANEKEKRTECLGKLERIVKVAVDQGKLPAQTDTFLAMQAINGYLIGLIYEWLIDPAAYRLEEAAAPMIDTFLAGLLARPPLKKAR